MRDLSLTSLKFRRVLEGIPGAQSAWHLGAALKTAWNDSSEYSRKELLRDYERPISWAYSTDDLEIRRHRNELAMLDNAVGSAQFQRAMEIGCSEGIFTQQLVGRCQSLLATDFLPVALERACQRCGSREVHFALLDIREDPLPEDLDLICLIHVLDYVRSPFSLRKIRKRVAAALKPGGYLLLGTFDSSDESYWWSRYLVRGGQRIIDYFSAHAKLRVVESKTLPYPGYKFIDALLRKA